MVLTAASRGQQLSTKLHPHHPLQDSSGLPANPHSPQHMLRCRTRGIQDPSAAEAGPTERPRSLKPPPGLAWKSQALPHPASFVLRSSLEGPSTTLGGGMGGFAAS